MRRQNRGPLNRPSSHGADALASVSTALVVLLIASQGAWAVTASPSEVVFESPKASKTIRIEERGKAVPAAQIQGFKLWASEHDYHYMFTYKKADGSVTLTPTDKIEMGSYRLEIDTTQGKAEVTVYTPLNDLENIVQQQAKAMGISVEEARKKLGLTTTLPEPSVSLKLPAVYYEGQTLSVEMPKDEGMTYRWSVNGEPVAAGPDANALTYTFTKPGSYVIAYQELRDGKVAASTMAYTTVAQLPPVKWQTKTGESFTLEAPPGYDLYTWNANDNRIGTGQLLTYTFENPGNYMITCTARNSGPDAEGYALYRWSIEVTN